MALPRGMKDLVYPPSLSQKDLMKLSSCFHFSRVARARNPGAFIQCLLLGIALAYFRESESLNALLVAGEKYLRSVQLLAWPMASIDSSSS